jgi:two-component system response regulator MtrA
VSSPAAPSPQPVKELQQEHAIPAPAAFMAAEGGQNRAMPFKRPGRPRVLLVDDDARLVHIVRLYLQVQQFDVVTANCGEDAMRLLAGGLPDLAICDLMMPGIDGVTLCRQIRALPGGADLPIIVFTALSDTADVEAARAAGANQVITKPFSLTGLGAAVEALLPDHASTSA